MKDAQDMVFFSPERKTFYVLDSNKLSCDLCHKECKNWIYFIRAYTKKVKTENFICPLCLENFKTTAIYMTTVTVLKTDVLPKDTYPIFDLPPSLSNVKDLDIWAAASQNIEGEKVIDKTIGCHDPNFMIQADAKKPEQIEADLKAKDKASIKVSKLDNYFKEYEQLEAIKPDIKKRIEAKTA